VTDPFVPAGIEIVDVSLRSFFMTPASEPNLTNPEEVQEAIRNLKFNKNPAPNGILNRALKHLPQRTLPILVQIFKVVLLPITSLRCGSTLELSVYLNRGRIQHCPHSSVHWSVEPDW
jgi:hypothetical protein